jgi:hypothetical protein
VRFQVFTAAGMKIVCGSQLPINWYEIVSNILICHTVGRRKKF